MTNPLDSLLVEKYRPDRLSSLVVDGDVMAMLNNAKAQQSIPHLLFYGSAGTGKTSAAKVLAYDILQRPKSDVLYINASERTGIDVIRDDIQQFAYTQSFDGGIKIVILDEVDGLSSVTGSAGKSSAQQALRHVMEEYAEHVRFILTCNYLQKVLPAIQSRCIGYHFKGAPVSKLYERLLFILDQEGVSVDGSEKANIVRMIQQYYPDLRTMIQHLQRCTTDGKFKYTAASQDSKERHFASDILDAIISKTRAVDIRKMWIDHPQKFDNYHSLLINLFEVVVADSRLSPSVQRDMLIMINGAIYKHHIVMDGEINMFAAVIEMSQLFDD